MVTAFLLLGSNVGDREGYLEKAKNQIIEHAGKLVIASSIYETEAWGQLSQALFLNQVLAIETSLIPKQLLTVVQQIETSLGRHRIEKWAPRTLDIDILFYGSQTIETPDLIIPHPAIPQRKFTLMPIVEVAPGFVHPVLRKTMVELLSACVDPLAVNIYKSTKDY